MIVLLGCEIFFFLKQKTAYDMRISDWSSDVCSSDLEEQARRPGPADRRDPRRGHQQRLPVAGGARAAGVRAAARGVDDDPRPGPGLLDRHRVHHQPPGVGARRRSEEHTSELQSLMRISYAVFCLKKKKIHNLTDNEK